MGLNLVNEYGGIDELIGDVSDAIDDSEELYDTDLLKVVLYALRDYKRLMKEKDNNEVRAEVKQVTKPSLIGQVAALLDVEIGEEFEIAGFSDEKFFFDEKTLRLKGQKYWECDDLIGRLLNGKAVINKLPFTPQCGDGYFYIYQHGNTLGVGSAVWQDNLVDYQRKRCGNVFRTLAIAELKKYTVFSNVTEKPWKGIVDKEEEQCTQ